MLGKFNIVNWHTMNTKLHQSVFWFQHSISNKYISFGACDIVEHSQQKWNWQKVYLYMKKKKKSLNWYRFDTFPFSLPFSIPFFHSVFQSNPPFSNTILPSMWNESTKPCTIPATQDNADQSMFELTGLECIQPKVISDVTTISVVARNMYKHKLHINLLSASP